MGNGMRFWSLASSSVYGNAYLVTSGDSSVMIDCGVRLRRLERSLPALGVDPLSLNGIFITHEHGDHTRAMSIKIPFPVRYGVPVYGTPVFWQAWRSGRNNMPARLVRTISPGQTVTAGSLSVTAFRKQHDAVEPVGYLVTDGTDRLAVVTDLGTVEPELLSLLRGCEYLVFESNHDPELERRSGRPWPLVQRVMGDRGHLSNEQAAAALCRIVTDDTRVIVLAHLSCDCNHPDRAESVVGGELGLHGWTGRLLVAPAGEISPALPE